MSIAILLAVVGAAGLGLAVALAVQYDTEPVENPVLGRLGRYMVDDPEAEQPSPLAGAIGAVRRRISAHDESRRGSSTTRDNLSDALQKADLDIAPTEWWIILVAIGVAVGLVVWWRTNPIAGAAAAIVAPYIGGRFFLNFRMRRRMIKFDNQLGDVILLLSSSLRAGYSFAQAMDTVAAGAHPPAQEEFARVQRELALGVPVDEAMRRMVERNASEDLDLMVTAVQIQRIVGGNLAEILDTIAETIRERVRIKGEIRTLTAQARASGWIISLLPIGLAAILTVIAPDYFTPMFHEFLGLAMLGFGLVMMGIGIAIIRKIVDIKI